MQFKDFGTVYRHGTHTYTLDHFAESETHALRASLFVIIVSSDQIRYYTMFQYQIHGVNVRLEMELGITCNLLHFYDRNIRLTTFVTTLCSCKIAEI